MRVNELRSLKVGDPILINYRGRIINTIVTNTKWSYGVSADLPQGYYISQQNIICTYNIYDIYTGNLNEHE